jgi:hypothetical protein
MSSLCIDSKLCFEIFEQSIVEYHKLDNVDQAWSNPYPENSLEAILYHKNWIDTVQWHFEDLVRDPNVTDREVTVLKRRIDKSNQDRTDKVELLDDWIIHQFKEVKLASDAKLNTESPAWVIDRMSILALKIYHMQEQVNRSDVDSDHKNKCQAKLEVLLEQKNDLSMSFDELITDVANGKKKVKVYRQMKMYNDEKLNPVLYKRTK